MVDFTPAVLRRALLRRKIRETKDQIELRLDEITRLSKAMRRLKAALLS